MESEPMEVEYYSMARAPEPMEVDPMQMERYLFYDGIDLDLEASTTEGQRDPMTTMALVCVELCVAWVPESSECGIVNHRVSMAREYDWAALADVSTCSWISSAFDVISYVAELRVHRRWEQEITSFLREAMQAARNVGSGSAVKVRFIMQALNCGQRVRSDLTVLWLNDGRPVARSVRRQWRRYPRQRQPNDARLHACPAFEQVRQWTCQPGRDERLLQEDCSICMDEFRGGAKLAAMPCSHAFHRHCLLEWLKRSPLCPLCRHKI